MGEARRKSCIWWKPGPSHSLSSRLSADLHPIKRLPCFPHSPPPPSCPLLLLYACLRTETFSKTLRRRRNPQLSQLPHAVTVLCLHSPLRGPTLVCPCGAAVAASSFLLRCSSSTSRAVFQYHNQLPFFFILVEFPLPTGKFQGLRKEIKVIKKNINKEARPARIQVGTGDEDGERPSLRH